LILKTIDFTKFYKNITGIFAKYFTEQETAAIMEYVEILSDANFRCYRANMFVIDNRKNDKNPELISDLEWVARSVGEHRVASKANINKYIAMVKSVKEPTEAGSWVSDDIVYSIGEMMDRLSIETIKREDFRVNNRPSHMIEASQKLSDRVDKYLRAKLEEVSKKGFYECVYEQRTYDIENIVEELVI
jgi:hypothetical protein